MSRIFFALPGNEKLANSLADKCDAELGVAVIRHFPDHETFIKIDSNVKNRQAFLVCTLNNPDEKLLPLYLLSNTLKESGASSLCLIAPYLAYMRQDKIFHSGEGLTSKYFAKLISSFADSLITIDPHLHRIHNLSEIYTIPTTILHAGELISTWIKENIKRPVLVGPDSESEQWVSIVAKKIGVPYIVLQKIRRNDKEVEVSIPHLDVYKSNTPIVVDDIISTARTMINTVGHIITAGMQKPVCIGVHGIFADNAYEELTLSGIKEIITCNTIDHKSNKIFIDRILADGILQTKS